MTLSIGIILLILLSLAVLIGLILFIAMIVTALRSTPKPEDSGFPTGSADEAEPTRSSAQ